MNPDSAVGRFVRRHPVLRVGTAVSARTAELNGGYAANALTLVSFVSLFPLLLVIVSVTGLLTGSNPDLADDLVEFLGLTGNSARTMTDTLARARASGTTGSIVGLVGMAWSGLALVGALRFVVNLPHGTSVKGLRARVLGVPWLLGAASILAVSLGISTVLNWLPGWTAPIAVLVSLGIDTALFTWTFWFLDTERPPPRHLLPGAVTAAVCFGLLKMLGTIVLPRLVADSSATYGALGTVFAILTWLLLFSRILVYAVVVNDVWADEWATDAEPDVDERDGSDGDRSDDSVDATSILDVDRDGDRGATSASVGVDAPQDPE